MKVTAKIGCNKCGFEESISTKLPFNCEDYICPNCLKPKSMSILMITNNDYKFSSNQSITDLMGIGKF